MCFAPGLTLCCVEALLCGFFNEKGSHHTSEPPWPNGQGVGLLIQRLWVQVALGMFHLCALNDIFACVGKQTWKMNQDSRVSVRQPLCFYLNDILIGSAAHDSVFEWLRRWTRNPLGSARRDSNPLAVAVTSQHCPSRAPLPPWP